MLVALVRNLPPEAGSRRERSGQLDAEPFPERLCVGQRLPHTRARRAKKNAFFDPICAHVQPPGCILTISPKKGNQIVAVSAASLAWRRRDETKVSDRRQ